MNHEGHWIVGCITALIAMLLLHVFSLELVALALLASILPDVDLRHSTASKIVVPIAAIALAVFIHNFMTIENLSFIASWLVALILAIVLLALFLLPLRKKHRGITHSWKAAVVFGITGGIFLGFSGGVVAFASYASHLIVDKL
ncbi:MAG: metal-dependent hydrolase [Candidatus Micrarchaeota archaeon]